MLTTSANYSPRWVEVATMGEAYLSDQHRRELVTDSAIAPDVVAERGYRTITRPSVNDQRPRQEMRRLGFPTWATREDHYFPGLLLPMYRATGEAISAQWKPRVAVPNRDGKKMKYASIKGQTNRIDVHPRNRDRIIDITEPLWVTEGIKKADSLTSQGLCVIALTGVFNWRSQLGTIGDWEDVPLKGRRVIVCFDADARSKPNVLRAMVRFGRWLKSKGAAKVGYLIVPEEVNGAPVKGADDFLAAGGTVDGLKACATTQEPDPGTADDTFTDSRLAETIAEEVLDGQYVWAKGLGWLHWDQNRWAECSDEAVGEEVRQFALSRFAEVIAGMRQGGGQAGNTNAIDGWRSMLSVGRQRAVLGLCRGIVERTADDFDRDPDLLNTPGGVVSLRTGEVSAHDPDLLLTKLTAGSYRAGFTHPDWDKALEALPEPERAWLQARVGQAVTGVRTPDGLLPVLQGSGENGKSLLTSDGLVPALGDYADSASSKLFAAEKGSEHSTERADLRGRRLLIGEELTEERALNVTAIKRVQDVARIKARYVHKDNMTFATSHSLFVTSNYEPIVNETDHGTWRRLALVKFPYTFRKRQADVTTAHDRLGDPGLKRRVELGADGQHDAIVTWAVEGARRWYADAGTIAVTERIEADTLAWRGKADRVLGFWSERLIADRDACILAEEMLGAFNEWLAENGHRQWPKETFVPRFGDHDTVRRHAVEEQRTESVKLLARASRWAPAISFTAPRALGKRERVWAGVRFRTLDDQEKRDGPPEVPDPSGKFPDSPRGGFSREVGVPRAG